MNYLSFKRGFKLGLDNFKRNTFLSIATIAVTAVIIFVFNIIISANFIMKSALDDLSQKIELTYYIQDNTEPYIVNEITENLNKMQEVEAVEYVSKEKALEDFSKLHPEETEFLKRYDMPNPLQASLKIKANTPKDYEVISTYLDNSKYVTYLSTQEQTDEAALKSTSKNLSNVSNFTTTITFWIIIIFSFGGILIFINALRLTIFSRKNEIYIMRLVGAKQSFIRLPFLVEGIIYSFLAVLLSMTILILFAKIYPLQNSSIIYYLSNIHFMRLFTFEILLSIIIGGISSIVVTNKYLKCKLSEY